MIIMISTIAKSRSEIERLFSVSVGSNGYLFDDNSSHHIADGG